jgi:CRP/FNR family transcriptional regulator
MKPKKISNGELDNRIKILHQMYSFSQLKESEVRRLAEIMREQTFKKGEIIFQEGEPPAFFSVVKEGRVRLFKESISGKDCLITIANPGYPLNMVALFDGQSYFLTAQAIDKTTLLLAAREQFLTFVNQYPQIAIRLLTILSRALNSAFDRISDLMGERVDQRVYNVLLMLSSKYGKTLIIKRKEIAEMAGTTIETAARIMADLKTKGIIRSHRGQIVILKWMELQNISHRPRVIFV